MTTYNEMTEGAGRGEVILVVEDDPGLCELAKRILVKFGYKVHSANHHLQATALCEKHGKEIDLLLTDVVMPEVGGKELAERLTKRYPHLLVIYMSGYTDEVILKQGVMEGSMKFIQKPFTPAALAQKVREVLDGY